MNLIESIYEEPEKWRATEHTLTHENGARLWTCNGRFSCVPYPGGNFGLFKRMAAWKAYRWWCENAPVSVYGNK